MKVYIVEFHGTVQGVFSTQEKAEAFVAKYRGEDFEGVFIGIHTVDTEV